MTAVTDPNPKLQKVYQYLKKQNAVKSPTFEDFQTKMQSDPKTAEKVYNYLKDNGKLKARNIDEFSESMGLKKKDVTSTDQTVPSGNISEPGSQVLESGLTEDQERQRNLQQLAQQPVVGEQTPMAAPTDQAPVVPTWSEQVQQQMADSSQGSPAPEQKKKEPLGFLDTLSAIWTDLKASKDKPADPAQVEPSPFLNAIKRGTAMAEQASLINPFEGTDLDDKQINRVAELQKETASLPASPEYQEFNQSKDVGGALSALAKNPVKIIAELTGESMSALVQYGASRMAAGAGTGALIGSIIPGIGTVSGAGGGAVVGMADSSLGLEYSGKFVESLQEQGVDVQDPKDLKRAFEDDTIISNARSSALKKGIPIAMFDLISGGIAGKIASKPAKSLIGKIGQGAAEFGVQAAMGGAGEAAGQAVSGEQINPSAIIAEMVGELGTTPIEVSNALLTFNRKQNAPEPGNTESSGGSVESKVSEQPVTGASPSGTPKVETVNTNQPVSEGITEPVAAEPSGEPVTQNVTDAPVTEKAKKKSQVKLPKSAAKKEKVVETQSDTKSESEVNLPETEKPSPEKKAEEVVEEKSVPAEPSSKFPVTPDVVEKYISRVRSPRGRYGAAEGVLDVDLGVKGYSREEKEQFEGQVIKSFIEGDLPKKSLGKKELLDADLLPKSTEVNVKPIPQKIKPKSAQQSLQDNATDDSELRPAMMGVYRDAENKVMVATDGYILVKIPDETIDKSEIVHMSKAGTEDHRRVINERYPDYNSVVPESNPIKEKASVQEWLDKSSGVARANKFFERRYSSSGSSGKAIAGRAAFGDMDIYFDPEMMQRVLTVFAENGVKDVTVEFFKPNKAILLKGNGITGLVMPIQGMDIPYKTFISRDLTDADRDAISNTDIDRLEKQKKEILDKYKKAKVDDALDKDYYQRKLDDIKEQIAALKPKKKDAPKTDTAKPSNVPTATETSSEGNVERTESTDEKYATMKKKQSDTIASAAKKWDTLSESDQENIKKLAKSWQMEDLIPKREQSGNSGQLKDVGKDQFVNQTIKSTGLAYDDLVMWRQSADRLPDNLDTNLHKRIIEDAIKRGEEPRMALSTADMLATSVAEEPNFESLRGVIERGGDVSDSVKFFEENGIPVPKEIKDYRPKFKKGDRVIIDSKRRTDNGSKAEVETMLPDGTVSIKVFRSSKPPSFTNVKPDQIKLQEEPKKEAPKKSKTSDVTDTNVGDMPKKKSDIAKEKLAERARKVKDKYNDLYNENLGAIYDPKARAKKYYDFHRELVGLAKDAIALGVATVEEFAESIGRKVDDFMTRAFEDAQRESKGEPVAVKSQKFFETIESSSEQKEKLSQAIETDQTDRSDYLKRRIKDVRDNKAFKKGANDIADYTVQSMELANTESDNLIADLQNELGDKAGLLAAFESLKDNQIPPLMEGPLASKLMLKMQALRMNKKAVEVLDWLQEGGRDSARRLASLQATASPESTVSRMFAGLEKVKQNALSKPFKGNQTYMDTLKALQDELAAVNKKYDDLLENGTFDKSMLPEPEAPSQSQASKEIIKKAKALRAEGMSDLNKFFKKSRGQANMGAPLDPELFKALSKILKSYLLEFEGNIIAGYEKFRKDVSSQYPITSSELDANKTDLLNANKETIEEFKAKKQMQVIDKILAPEGKETPEQRKKRRETAKKILKDFKEGATEEQLAENFADIAGFETVSPEDTAKIVEMTNRYAQYNAEGKNELAYKAWYDLMMFLEDLGLQQRQAHETILDLWYTGVLSGLTTVARSIKGSLLSTGNFTATRLLANPKVAPLAIASMIKGLRGAGGTYRHIMGTGKTSVKLQDFSPRMVRLTDRLWDKSFGDLKARDKFLKGLYALPTFMYRNIIAFDQILKDAVSEGNIAVFEFNNTKEEKTLSDRLKKTQERLQNMRNAEVSALVQDEINVMQKAGEEIPTGYKDRRFRELKNEMRNADHVKRAVEDAARASLVSHPVGTLGQFYSYWENAMNINDDDAKVTKAGKFALRSIFPFMRIGFNYVNAGLDYTPVGFYRALKQSVWTKEGIRPQEGFERREYLVRASVGMALYTSLLASMFDFDDEDGGLKLKPKKDRWIEIYGPLTGKWWEHDDVAKDAKPWTVRFKNPVTGEWSGVYSYADNPIGFMLAPLGIMHDEIMFTDFKDKTEKKELKHEEKDIAYLVGAGIHGTFRYAMDQSFNQGLNTIGNLMAPESPEKFGQEVENLVMRPTQGFYPSIYRQLYDQYRAASDTPEKQANHWYEKPAKLMPLVDNIIKNEKYDVFGYPIRRDLNVPLIPDMVLKMAKDNLDYREDLKEWKLLHKFEEVTIGGSFLPPQTYEGKGVTDAQKDEYARIAGMEMRRLVNSHWDALNEMDAERLQKRLLKYKSTARKKAEREVLKEKK